MSKITAVLLLACLLNTANAETIEEYTAGRIAAIKVPAPPHPLKGTAAKTYFYWHMAVAEVNVCMDQQTIRKDHFWTAGKVGPLITHDLRTISPDGVDPDAVDAVLQIADTFDDMRRIAHSMNESAAKLGIGLAGGSSGTTADGKEVISGPEKIAGMLRARDEYDRNVRTLLQHRYGVPFQELILENVSSTTGTWLGYDGVCAAG
jgi:hypothetical protein